MATPFRSPDYPADVKLEYGVPQPVAFRYLDGKSVESRFPGGRCMFSLTDGRKLFLDDEDSTNLRHELTRLGVQPAECVLLTKIKHARGGGHGIRVEREQPASELEQTLARSIAMAQRGESFQKGRGASQEVGASPAIANQSVQKQQSNTSPSPEAAGMIAAMCAAVDAVIATQQYATSRGLGLTFGEESVRAIGLSVYIGAQRGRS